MAVLLLILSAVLLAGYWNTFPHDLASLYVAAQFYELGLFDLVYQSDGNFFWDDIPVAWRDATKAIAAPYGDSIVHYAPYVYPPLWAAVLAPVTVLVSFSAFAKIVLCVNIAALLGMIWLGYHLLRPVRVSTLHWVLVLVLMLATSAVPHLALNLGQPQIGVSFLTLLAFACLASEKPVLAGGWLALAASIKLAPAMFVIIFLMERNWRALVSFCLIGAGLAVLSVTLTGWPLHDAFLSKLAELDGGTYLSRINLGLEIELFQLWLVATGDFSWFVREPGFIYTPVWIRWVVKLALVLGVVLTFLATHRMPTRARIWHRIILISLVLLFTSPLGWVHYMILPLMLLPGLLEYSKNDWVMMFLALLLVGYSLPVYLWIDEVWWAFIPQMSFYFGLALLVFLVVLLMRPRTPMS